MRVIVLLLFLLSSIYAAGDLHFTIDQFGYYPNASKVAVIKQSQSGQFSPDTFVPTSTLELKRSSDSKTVYSGPCTSWESGKTDPLSGDKGWWFDFSSVTTPGTYFIWDEGNQVGSHSFDISQNPYEQVLNATLKSFYYQRCGAPKETPYADNNWSDIACHTSDANTPYAFDSTISALNRDLSGGWHDAGDYNKYITFLGEVMHPLLQVYQDNPDIWHDTLGIPESGNGIPDILDEIDVELSWMLKMQDDDGGVFIKMGVTDYSSASPASAHHTQRYYGKKASSSSIMFAGIVAHAASVYANISGLSSKVPPLTTAAEKAWQWYHNNEKRDDYDNGEIKSGDADRSITQQEADAVVASLWLWVLTGKSEYHNYFKANYTKLQGMDGWWGPYKVEEGEALMHYTTLPQADASVVQDIRDRKAQGGKDKSFAQFIPTQHLYRSYMPKDQWHWGSMKVLSVLGEMNNQYVHYAIDPQNQDSYSQRAWNVLHYIHGVNPFSKVYISNMYNYGAENSVNEFYHSWFNDGSEWDNVQTSKGPAPGFVVGGPNQGYSGSYPLFANQPPEKMYTDYNDPYPEPSWEITENSISYNATYLSLLGRLISDTTVTPITPSLGYKTAQSTLSISLTNNTLKGGITPLPHHSSAKISLINIRGQNIYTTTISLHNGAFSVNLPSLAKGIYLVSVKLKDTTIGVRQIVYR